MEKLSLVHSATSVPCECKLLLDHLLLEKITPYLPQALKHPRSLKSPFRKPQLRSLCVSLVLSYRCFPRLFGGAALSTKFIIWEVIVAQHGIDPTGTHHGESDLHFLQWHALGSGFAPDVVSKISSLSVSTSTSMKQRVDAMCHVQF